MYASTEKPTLARKTVQRVVDCAFGLALIGLMFSNSLAPLAHEWLGIAAFALFVVHTVLNRRWWRNLARGRYSSARIIQTALIAGMTLCIALLLVSALVLSQYAFSWLPAFPGKALARRIHLICSNWLFILAFIHAGTHMRIPVKTNTQTGVRLMAIIILIALAVWQFVTLDMPGHLFYLRQFAFIDANAPAPVTFVRYALVACGALAIGFLLKLFARPRPAQ